MGRISEITSTDVDVVTGEILPHVSHQRDTFGVVSDAIRLADVICDTEMVPQVLRNRPEAIVAVMLMGYELGLGPMQSLQSIDLIQGRPELSAEGMRALVLAAGHTIIVDATDERATAKCHRRDWSPDAWVPFTFTMHDAERAGLAGKDNWKKYPRSMLSARVTTEGCRSVFPDVIGGVSYTAEEIDPDRAIAPPPAVDDDALCAIDGADEIVETIKAEPDAVRSAFRNWRKSKGYGMAPETPEQVAEWRAELAKIVTEYRRDGEPYETPIRGDSAPVGSGLD